MKKQLLFVFAIACFSIIANASDVLKVDFTITDSDSIEDGFEPYFMTNEDPASFTEESYDAFGTTITFEPRWTEPYVDASQRAVFREDIVTQKNALLCDWIGSDLRDAAGGYLVFTLGGLPSGEYTWTSYHHDNLNQKASFIVTINDGSGETVIRDVDLTFGSEEIDLDTVGIVEKVINSDGSDITIQLSLDESVTLPISAGTRDTEAFVLCNGFIIEKRASTAFSSASYGSIKVYPNPAKNQLFFGGFDLDAINVKIVNIAGENVLSNTVTAGSFVDISNLPAGIYLVDVNNKMHIGKIIID